MEEKRKDKSSVSGMAIALAFSLTAFLMSSVYRTQFSNQTIMMIIAVVLLIIGSAGTMLELFKDSDIGSSFGAGIAFILLGYFIARINYQVTLYASMALYFFGIGMTVDGLIKVVEFGPKTLIEDPKVIKKRLVDLIMLIAAIASIIASSVSIYQFFVN